MTDETAPSEVPPEVPPEVPSEAPTFEPISGDSPVAGAQRIAALDTLRGASVLGILLVNILTFGLPATGALNPALDGGDFTPPNVVSWFVTHVLLDGKFRAIFSMLFGAGALLLLDRAENRGAGIRGADVYYRRTLWLILFGILHAYLIWWGDVLFWFGVFGLVLFPFRNRSPAFLITAGVLLLALEIPIAIVEHVKLVSMRDRAREVGAESMSGKKLTEEEQIAWWAWERKKRELNPHGSDMQREIDAQRNRWWKVFVRRMDRAIWMQSNGVYRYGLTDVCSMMLIGMGLMKLGVFSGGLSAGWYRWLALAGYGIGLPISTYDGIQAVLVNFDPLEHGWLHQCVFPVSRLAVALGHVGLIMLICQSRWFAWLTAALAAVGRMALTNYVLQSILCTAYFDGWGLGRFATLERYQLLYLVLVVWAVEVVGSLLWLSVFEFGPIEWLWRALTYWRRQPIFARVDTR